MKENDVLDRSPLPRRLVCAKWRTHATAGARIVLTLSLALPRRLVDVQIWQQTCALSRSSWADSWGANDVCIYWKLSGNQVVRTEELGKNEKRVSDVTRVADPA
ncbi:uncharacterized protein LACBIDRAFT_309355 [Laccaria bicolor S238N-H82]|uniref:Predicted protein n=1 Tax=Laccaria bicolor (strain S238N-H82 / ATCC MYA-4686) TaxID=486041 RepID=B0E4P7_LACBS|nr:uncharacterized protein LACBIDRAFT_309355 [Laccaria bicolor S238N-H82]EDQ98185.1 predicted protein [Laccaria bicolor S238N-H82]|eukprot:XP_001891165.1 predicted protein [Laccaria bicolor S238N-H82]